MTQQPGLFDGAAPELPATYTGMYAMHKYWSKKPHNVVARYIRQFSQPGDIVLDTFCGSGITVVESVKSRRRAIGVDINPSAVAATRMALEHIDIPTLQTSFERLREAVSAAIDTLYQTDCPRCGNPAAIATHTIWEQQQPREIWVSCSACACSRTIKTPTERDGQAALFPALPPRWYPQTYLWENGRINARTGMTIADLFTPRALSALSLLLQHIREIDGQDIRAVLEFCFSAALAQTSKMVFVIRRRGKTRGVARSNKAEVGSWVIGYWLPPEHFEIHVWRCFENRFKRILKGKREVNTVIPTALPVCTSYAELHQAQAGYWVACGSATNLAIADATVDYIFTDPPHGNRIPYLELSLMWNAWLGQTCDWEQEIVISESRERHKDIDDYQVRLRQAFQEFWRVLKSGRYCSVAFNSLDDATWLVVLNTCLAVGFAVVDVQPLAYSARSVVQDNRRNALKTDFVITCQKCDRPLINQVSYNEAQDELTQAIRRVLASSADGVETHEVLTQLLGASIPQGFIFKITEVLATLNRLGVYASGRWHL